MFPNGRNSFYLFIIVLSQFAGTSLWFLGNAVLDDFAKLFSTPVNIALVTSIIQAGFIAGTLVFAFFTVADRFKSTHLFFVCSLIAALFNLSIIWFAKDVFTLCVFRFFTGFFLAGIYPVGMKIASDIFSKKLGNALGFLVGALVIGTAFPHLLKAQIFHFSFSQIIFASSFIAIFGGALIYFFIPASKPLASGRIQYSEVNNLFRITAFRSAALGYFGHMWELYAFWAFVPLAIQLHNSLYKPQLDIPFWSFFIIAIGALSCVIGGIASKKMGSLKVASLSLFVSGACCLFSPFLLSAQPILFLLFIFTWSFFVIADSPQFSALVAQSVPAELKGTALTLVTSIGFGITIVSIQILQKCISNFGAYGFWLLALGPLFGLFFLFKKRSISGNANLQRQFE